MSLIDSFMFFLEKIVLVDVDKWITFLLIASMFKEPKRANSNPLKTIINVKRSNQFL